MVMEATGTSSGAHAQTCPPYLALQAIETAITPTKVAKYKAHYDEGHVNDSDPVFTGETGSKISTLRRNPKKPKYNPPPRSQMIIHWSVLV